MLEIYTKLFQTPFHFLNLRLYTTPLSFSHFKVGFNIIFITPGKCLCISETKFIPFKSFPLNLL